MHVVPAAAPSPNATYTMGVAVLDTKCLSINPTPPWQRASPPPPRATPAEVQARRQALRQAAQLRAARTELAARVRLLSSPQGRAAFVATLERWTSFADAKMAQGLRELAAMDADVRAGRVPPPRACESKYKAPLAFSDTLVAEVFGNRRPIADVKRGLASIA
ncbi:hypothetical protein CspeluHIS016_0203410 [Cutaneotrichosporon spelunceum]|uniref:Uncharacterized protein n=1 Tax=Cutaneotrichosporon spelunceum TaxID=1672016 RepID=A0AAD3TRV9_9TREE|nr:hypothetical protein CspeluHIS016_0203410 [Cutaneotrichosporon spelunceum]